MVELELRRRRRGPWWRRLFSLLRWLTMLTLLALCVPGPFGPAHLGITVVSGQSMLPTFQPADLVVTWRSDAYPAGTPVVYGIPAGEPGAGMNVVHRVVEVRPDGTHVTQGDNNDHIDPWRPRDGDVQGRVVLRVPRGGIMLRWFGSPLVLALVSGLLVGASAFGWAGRGGGAPPPGGDGGPRRRHRRTPTPTPSRVAMRVAAVGAALAAATTASGAQAAEIVSIATDNLYTDSVPSSVAANPVSYEQHLTSETALQYCATVTVTNHSSQAVEWEITLNISEQPYNATSLASSYNVTTVSFQPDLWRVKGVPFNSVLAPGASYEWGYCGARSPTGLVDATATVDITQSDTQSYCATVTVSTASTDWIRWRITLDHATAGLTDTARWLAAEPTNTSNLTTVSFDALTGAWVTRGVASNEYVRSGASATFSYCAPAGAAAPLVDATLSVSITSSDSQQYCATVTASTASATYVKWKATINHSTPGLTSNTSWLTAAPTNLNNAATVSFDAGTGTWVVQGLSYNQLIKAGSPATWGFCAPTNQSADLVDATVSVTRNGTSSSPGGAYCADVTVSTTSTDWVKWRAVLTQATPNLTGPNYVLLTQPTNFWNATSIDFTSGVGTFQWRLRGVGWNDLIKAGSPQTFGFCR